MALLWPAMRSAGRYEFHRLRVLDAVHGIVRGAMRAGRAKESPRLAIDAGSIFEAIVGRLERGQASEDALVRKSGE
jgi:hypothetical protein